MQKDVYKSFILEEKGCRNSCRVVLVVCWRIATSYFESNMSWAAAFESKNIFDCIFSSYMIDIIIFNCSLQPSSTLDLGVSES
jgi:hypothetical protein